MVAGGQLAPVVVGASRVDDEDVPVERAAPGERHRGHELDLVLGEGTDAGDELERRAGVVAHRARESHELVVGRGP